MRIIVLAVGRLRPPFADDMQHYQKLLARHARVELSELREDEQVARRIPERAHVSLLDREGDQLDSAATAEVLEEITRLAQEALDEIERRAEALDTSESAS